MDLIKVMEELYSREINFSITTFWDGGYTVKLGDELNGFIEDDFTHDPHEIAQILFDMLNRYLAQ